MSQPSSAPCCHPIRLVLLRLTGRLAPASWQRRWLAYCRPGTPEQILCPGGLTLLTMLDLTPSTPAPTDSGHTRPGLLPALVLVGLPPDRCAAMNALASVDQFEQMTDGALQADLEVPPGTWRLWADRHVALWVGTRADAVPMVRSNAKLDLFEAALALSDSGLMLRDLRVQTAAGWGKLMRAHEALRHLAEHPDVTGVRGVWATASARGVRAVRAEIHSSGSMFAETAAMAWLIAEAVGASLHG